MTNPARALRAALEGKIPLKWDTSGRALLVSDASAWETASATARAWRENGRLYIDLPAETYAALLRISATPPAVRRDAWFALRALCFSILSRPYAKTAVPPALDSGPDLPLLRAALLAEARGPAFVRPFVETLRAADAVALRIGATASARACAALLATWMEAREGE